MPPEVRRYTSQEVVRIPQPLRPSTLARQEMALQGNDSPPSNAAASPMITLEQQELLAHLYEAYSSSLIWLAAGFVHLDGAEDVMHKTFLKIIEGMEDGSINLPTLPNDQKRYLNTAVTRKAIDELRRGGKNISITSLEQLEEDQFEPSSMPQELSLDITNSDLLEAVLKLSPKLRSVILLINAGYTQGEISEILKISQSTLRTRLQRAREKAISFYSQAIKEQE